MNCPECNYSLPKGTYRCPSCGADVPLKKDAPQKERAARSNVRIKLLILIMLSVLLLGALGFLAWKFLWPLIEPSPAEQPAAGLTADEVVPFTGNDYVLYVRKGKLYYSDLSDESIKLLSDYDSALSEQICVSEDGTLVFYPEHHNGDAFDLYYNNTTASKSAQKIDSDVVEYRLINGGKGVVYRKKSGVLCRHDLSKATTVTDAATALLACSKDGQIIYFCSDNTYSVANSSAVETIGKNLADYSFTQDCKTIYYRSGRTFCQKTIGAAAKTLASDVLAIGSVDPERGTFYFTRKATNANADGLMIFVDDDLAEVDAAKTEPTEPSKPQKPDSNGDLLHANQAYMEYRKAYQQYEVNYQNYLVSYYEYQNKLERDDLRAALKAAQAPASGDPLYFYDGAKENLLSESAALHAATNSLTDESAAVQFYKQYSISGGKKLKMSEFEAFFSEPVIEQINSTFSVSQSFQVAIGNSTTALSLKNPDAFALTSDHKTLYVTDGASAEAPHQNRPLYQLSAGGKPILYANAFSFQLINDTLYTMSDYNAQNETFRLTVNGTELCKNAHTFGKAENGTIYVGTAPKNGAYTLNRLNGTKLEAALPEAVCGHYSTPGGKLLYLTDLSNGEGDLFYFDGSNGIELESDVGEIFFNRLAK